MKLQLYWREIVQRLQPLTLSPFFIKNQHIAIKSKTETMFVFPNEWKNKSVQAVLFLMSCLKSWVGAGLDISNREGDMAYLLVRTHQ